MKLGTLTLVFPSNDNYGAFLQGYGLVTAINEMKGHSAVCLPLYELEPKASPLRYIWNEARKHYGSTIRNVPIRYLKRFCYVGREFIRFLRHFSEHPKDVRALR